MENNLENYLTPEEKKCMEQLVAKAMKRREENGDKTDRMLPFEFVVVNCQCHEEVVGLENINHMLEGMCQCIREHGCCARQDELLPF